MVEIAKQVAYWREGAEEDAAVARQLVGLGRIRHGLFFAHLALEKALKALVCQRSEDLAPRIHNLVRLTQRAGLTPSESQLDLLAELNQYSIEGRYPGTVLSPPTLEEAQQLLENYDGVLQWLISQL